MSGPFDTINAVRRATLPTLDGVSPVMAKSVLLHLALAANGDGEDAWPSQERLAMETGASVRSVGEAMRALAAAGLIQHTGDRPGRRGSGKPIKVWALNLAALEGMAQPAASAPPNRQPASPQPAATAYDLPVPTPVPTPDAVPTGPGAAHPLLPPPPIAADEVPGALRLRKPPTTRDAATLIGAWARGVQAATGKPPLGAHRTRFAKVAQTYARQNDLAAFPPEQWLRLVDTAYILGTCTEFALLDAFHGGGGKPPRIPASCRYRIGSRGGVSTAQRLNIDQPAASWEGNQ